MVRRGLIGRGLLWQCLPLLGLSFLCLVTDWDGPGLFGEGLFDVRLLLSGLSFVLFKITWVGIGLFDVCLLVSGLSIFLERFCVEFGLLGIGLARAELSWESLLLAGLFLPPECSLDGIGLFEECLLLLGLSFLFLKRSLAGIGLVESGVIGTGLAGEYLLPFGLSFFFLRSN